MKLKISKSLAEDLHEELLRRKFGSHSVAEDRETFSEALGRCGIFDAWLSIQETANLLYQLNGKRSRTGQVKLIQTFVNRLDGYIG